MQKNYLLLFVICLCIAAKCLALENLEPIKRDILAVPKTKDAEWYKLFYDYTKWPDERNLPALIEIDNNYSPEEFFNKVTKRGIIEEGWRKRALRVSKWISTIDGRYDAYLYRQKIEDGFIHICTTRKTLIVAYVSDKDVNYIEDPNTNISDIANQLFILDFSKDPNWLGFRNGRINNIILGKGLIYSIGKRTNFGVGYCLGKNTAIFNLRLLEAPGVIHGIWVPPAPLFKSVTEYLLVWLRLGALAALVLFIIVYIWRKKNQHKQISNVDNPRGD